jgi:hypothetical protein
MHVYWSSAWDAVVGFTPSPLYPPVKIWKGEQSLLYRDSNFVLLVIQPIVIRYTECDNKYVIILKLVVCILLRVLGQVQGFRLTQHWFEYFIYIYIYISA